MAIGTYPNKAAQNVAEFMRDKSPETAKKKSSKLGRPKKGEVHKISLSVPVEIYEGVELASYFFRGNITAYINNLIHRDLERNLEKYREFKTMMEEMNQTL